MSFGLHESRRSARRRRRWRLVKWTFGLAVLAALGVSGFESGKALSESELRQTQRDVARLNDSVASLQRENEQLKTAAETARIKNAELQRRVPTGELKGLMELIDEQLKKGAKIDRLRFLVSAASGEESCTDKPVTKRFIVRTPLYQGSNSVVTLADGALTVTGEGTAAEDAKGRAQAWFDVSKPVTLQFTTLNGAPTRVAGVLPLHHAVVVSGSEYRMNIAPGEERGFVNITADKCRFP